MLEAMDIVLICLGTVILLLALFAVFLLFIIRRRKSRQKPTSSQRAVARDYYLDRPPSITPSLKNGAAPGAAVVPVPDLYINANGIKDEQNHRKPDTDEVNLTVERISESIEVRRQEEIQHSRGANSIKRQNRYEGTLLAQLIPFFLPQRT
ncbi:hypothetical protein Y032_0001g314 [Ancylostoma ceylanicum]|uniref:Uncharacterized protein n=1 Tax=Ancylostoma ceylanicum TaxID=53326 RepID=A0A016W3K0_9BILA|nr:hypothetical protein Y032_0001g314 [Ancylostoma ceylanicum]